MVHHACPQCGAGDHGRPTLTIDQGRMALSASRAGEHLVLAWLPDPTGQARIGVDIELIAGPTPPAELVLHPTEEGADLIATWTAKEAILKLLGVGLDRAMPSIRVADFTLQPLIVPPGLVGRLALDLPS